MTIGSRYLWLFVAGVTMLSLLSSCGEEKLYIPDTSHISLENKLVRFEQLMMDLDTNNLASEIAQLNTDYKEFYSVYFRNVLPFDITTPDGFVDNLKGYLSDKRIRRLQDTTQLVFADFEETIMPQLDQSMKLLKFYVPEYEEPNVYTFISEFTYQQFLFRDRERDGVGIGLDMFLGSDYPYKDLDPNNSAFSNYMTRTYNRDHLVRKVMDIVIDDVMGRPPGSRLIDQMIHNGKRLYLLEKVIPSVADSVLLEYTAAQTAWVKDNEASIWAFLFDENLFYEANTMKINKYINPSPDSPGMPAEAPGRTANYIGWQIVKAYMKKYPDTSLRALIEINDSQSIMDDSRYKPARR